MRIRLCNKIYTYALLEERKICLCESIGFCNDGDEIDTRSKTLHNLDVKRL